MAANSNELYVLLITIIIIQVGMSEAGNLKCTEEWQQIQGELYGLLITRIQVGTSEAGNLNCTEEWQQSPGELCV